MPKNTSNRTLFIYPNDEQSRLIDVAYETSDRAWTRDKQGRSVKKSKSEFMRDLIFDSVTRDASFEGSRVALAGKTGKMIGTQLDNITFLLRVLIDLVCLALHISDKQKNEVFLRAATDPKFGSRLIDYRAYYRDKIDASGKSGSETEEL